MKQLLFILSFLASIVSVAQPGVPGYLPSTPYTQFGNITNQANKLVKLDANGKLDSNLLYPRAGVSGGSVVPDTASFRVAAKSFKDFQWERTNLKYDGTSNITDADLDSILYIKVSGLYYRHFFTGRAQVKWWGADPKDAVDDFPAIQRCFDKCISNRIWDVDFESGQYILSEGPVMRSGPLGSPAIPFSLSIHGAGNSYEPGVSGTQFHVYDKTGAALYIQKGRGCTVEDIYFQGQNTGLWAYDFDDVVNELNNFLTNGVSMYHCGIVVDPFSSPGNASKFPTKSEFFTESTFTLAGSSQLKINNCYFTTFAAAIINSPSGILNGENIFISNPFVTYCRSGICTGNQQNVTVKVTNYTGWGIILYHTNSEEYGLGAPPDVIGFNIAGGKWMTKIGAWYGHDQSWSYGYAESIYGFGEGQSSIFSVSHSRITLLGTQWRDLDDLAGSLIRNPHTVGRFMGVNFDNVRLTFYTRPRSMIAFWANNIHFSNGSVSDPVIYLQNGARAKMDNVIFELLGPTFEGVTETVTANQLITVSNVNNATNTYTFVDGTNSVQVGSYVKLNPKTSTQNQGEFLYGSGGGYFGGGVVTSVNSTSHVVTVLAIPYSMANGQQFDVTTSKFTVTPN